jgi:CRP-like cAMP-binding protein
MEARPQNRLLAHLKPRDLALLAPDLERITFPAGHVLFEPGDDVDRITFPGRDVVCALILDLPEGIAAETAMVGCDGAVGGIISEGEKPAFTRGVVQTAGSALQLAPAALDSAKRRSHSLRDHFARYADCLLAQVLQSVACNTVHDLDARLARWLLALQDRMGTKELHVTQEFVAQMLGVQRPYATRILGRFAELGLIEKSRGVIVITNRRQLERHACECYAYLRRHFERVLPGVYP